MTGDEKPEWVLGPQVSTDVFDLPGGFGYNESSFFQIVPLPPIYEAPLERLLVDRALGMTNLAIRIGLAVLNIWGALWICGIGVTLKIRPHRISSGDRHLHQESLGVSASRPRW